jgi:hypothetical protein
MGNGDFALLKLVERKLNGHVLGDAEVKSPGVGKRIHLYRGQVRPPSIGQLNTCVSEAHIRALHEWPSAGRARLRARLNEPEHPTAICKARPRRGTAAKQDQPFIASAHVVPSGAGEGDILVPSDAGEDDILIAAAFITLQIPRVAERKHPPLSSVRCRRS